MTGASAVLLAEVGEDGQQALILAEDEQSFLINTVR
jgi:hypothetical protein